MDDFFQSKMELESNLEALREYICFLKRLYEEVRVCQGLVGVRGGDRHACSLWLP